MKWFKADSNRTYFQISTASTISVSKSTRRRNYDDGFKAEALCLARENRATRTAARRLGISEKLLRRWQQAQAVVGAGSVEQAQERNAGYRVYSG